MKKWPSTVMIYSVAASQCLLLLIVETLVPPGAPITIVIDETQERRWGAVNRK